MGWEYRGANRYYYRAKREGGRVVKQYVGASGSLLAEHVALIEQGGNALLRLHSVTKKPKPKRLKSSRFEFIEASCDAAAKLAGLLVRTAGYHRHDRGPWRKRRMNTLAPVGGGGTAGAKLGLVPAKSTAITALVPADVDECRDVLGWAMDLPNNAELQYQAAAILKAHPQLLVEEQLADVQRSITLHLDTATPIEYETVTIEADRMRHQLLDGRAPLAVPYAERLLIERVIACGIVLYRAEVEFKEQCKKYHGKDLEPYQRIFDRTHNRYLKAIKTLAEVRRLALPMMNVALPGAVQINQADKQINFSRGGS